MKKLQILQLFSMTILLFLYSCGKEAQLSESSIDTIPNAVVDLSEAGDNFDELTTKILSGADIEFKAGTMSLQAKGLRPAEGITLESGYVLENEDQSIITIITVENDRQIYVNQKNTDNTEETIFYAFENAKDKEQIASKLSYDVSELEATFTKDAAKLRAAGFDKRSNYFSENDHFLAIKNNYTIQEGGESEVAELNYEAEEELTDLSDEILSTRSNGPGLNSPWYVHLYRTAGSSSFDSRQVNNLILSWRSLASGNRWVFSPNTVTPLNIIMHTVSRGDQVSTLSNFGIYLNYVKNAPKGRDIHMYRSENNFVRVISGGSNTSQIGFGTQSYQSPQRSLLYRYGIYRESSPLSLAHTVGLALEANNTSIVRRVRVLRHEVGLMNAKLENLPFRQVVVPKHFGQSNRRTILNILAEEAHNIN